MIEFFGSFLKQFYINIDLLKILQIWFGKKNIVLNLSNF